MNSGIKTLESLLGENAPGATFHDSGLLSLSIDYDKNILIADFDLCAGDPDGKDRNERERYVPGRLRIEGLDFWFMEPPSAPADRWHACPWLTADGPLSECTTPGAKLLMPRAEGKGFAWYFYFSDLNTFAYVAGDRVSFEWR
ncbi:MAG: hypothetical protein M0D55_14945 [Elusimicrobiota bacterium]|nr:MAG: hypothetical protein M0D55_14945 [Elusimicrobiota bacterium]